MSPILLDDTPKRPSPEPSPDFFWDHEILQTTDYLSPTEHCQEFPPERPATPPPPMSTGMDFSSPNKGSAEIQLAYARLQWKHMKLKKVLKEYKVLTKVIQEENTKYIDQALKNQTFIRKLKRRNKKATDVTLSWVKKFEFQRAKVQVLKNKVKLLKEKITPAGTRLNILANAISF